MTLLAERAPASPATTAAEAVAAARDEFTVRAGYLAACTLGVPTKATQAALRADAEEWAGGGSCAARYGAVVERVRSLYSSLVGIDAGRTAIGSQASVQTAIMAASVPDNAEVVCVEGDFSSIVFPFIAQAHRGVRVRHVPLERLAESITAGTWLVSFSLVQSSNGRVADVAAIVAAAQSFGARTFCDTTQAAGWMPVDATLFDATVCHSYKWLCAPRGASFLTVSERMQAELHTPAQAGWYAGDDVWGSAYGPTMRLAEDARRFDVSPAWPVWVGAEAALELFTSLDAAAVRDHAVALGDRFSEGLGLDVRGPAIIACSDAEGLRLQKLTDAGMVASGRAGCARVAFHLWNDEDDVDAALEALR